MTRCAEAFTSEKGKQNQFRFYLKSKSLVKIKSFLISYFYKKKSKFLTKSNFLNLIKHLIKVNFSFLF